MEERVVNRPVTAGEMTLALVSLEVHSVVDVQVSRRSGGKQEGRVAVVVVGFR